MRSRARGLLNPLAADGKVIMRFTYGGVKYELSHGKPIPIGYFLWAGASARVRDWLQWLSQDQPAVRATLLRVAGTALFKPTLKAEILAAAAKRDPDNPLTVWLLECEIDRLPAKRLLEIFLDCVGVPTRTVGWARVTVKKNHVAANLPEKTLKDGEELLARLVALAFAADHPNLFRGTDLANGTASQPSPQSPETSYPRSNNTRRCQPKGRKRK